MKCPSCLFNKGLSEMGRCSNCYDVMCDECYEEHIQDYQTFEPITIDEWKESQESIE